MLRKLIEKKKRQILEVYLDDYISFMALEFYEYREGCANNSELRFRT